MYGTLQKLVALFALGLAPLLSHADSVVYQYIGTVTQATGIYSNISLGATVMGTYAFNYANATMESGVVGGTAATWSLTADAGQIFGIPSPQDYVFYSTARIGPTLYATAPIGAWQSDAAVVGSQQGTSFEASEEQNPTSAPNYTTSLLSIYNPKLAYDATGLPISAGSTVLGNFQSVSNSVASELTYSISSLTPVPLPAAIWLMMSGICGLGMMLRTRRQVEKPH